MNNFSVMTNQYVVIFTGSQDEVIAYFNTNPPGDTTLVRDDTSGRILYATEWLASVQAA